MGRFKEAIEEDEAKLVEELDVDELWIHLELHKILTDQQLARCKAKNTRPEKAGELLRVLKIKDDKHYEGFCEALRRTGQNSYVQRCFQRHRAQNVYAGYTQPTATDYYQTAAAAPAAAVGYQQNTAQQMSTGQQAAGQPAWAMMPQQARLQQQQQQYRPTQQQAAAWPGTGSNRAKHDDTITVSTAYDDVDEDDEEDDGAPPEKVNVRRTTEEFYLQHCHEAYPMDRKFRGFACIINNHKFLGTRFSDRDGTDVDCKQLTDLFKQLHFKVQVFNDVSAVEMRDCIKQTAAKMVDGAKPQCFVLFVLSHGDILVNGTEVVFGTDGKTVSKMEIMDALSDTACPVLREVPRILFYQCGRGAKQGYAEEEEDTPTPTHFLVCYPTKKGYVCFRHPESGSRYVKSIVKVFMNKACDTDIKTMLEQVRVEQRRYIRWDRRHQEACYDYDLDLNKKFFFFPGVPFSE